MAALLKRNLNWRLCLVPAALAVAIVSIQANAQVLELVYWIEGQNFQVPSAQFVSPYYAVNKDSACPGQITVTLSLPVQQDVYVPYSTSDGTSDPRMNTVGGVGGTDYVSTSGSLYFPAGTVEQSFQVQLINNGQPGPDKTVNLQLGLPTGPPAPGPIMNATLRIVNTYTGTCTLVP